MFQTQAFQRKLRVVRLLIEARGFLLALARAEELIDLACTSGEVALACELYDSIGLLLEEEMSHHGLN